MAHFDKPELTAIEVKYQGLAVIAGHLLAQSAAKQLAPGEIDAVVHTKATELATAGTLGVEADQVVDYALRQTMLHYNDVGTFAVDVTTLQLAGLIKEQEETAKIIDFK